MCAKLTFELLFCYFPLKQAPSTYVVFSQICSGGGLISSSGICTAGLKAGYCICNPEFTGTNCELFSECLTDLSCGINFNSSNYCGASRQCICNEDYTGSHCSFLGTDLLSGYESLNLTWWSNGTTPSTFTYTEQYDPFNAPGGSLRQSGLNHIHNTSCLFS